MAAMNLDEQRIFEVARKINSRDAREAYLQQICGGDGALGQRIRVLLQAYDEDPNFLEAPAARLPSDLGVKEFDHPDEPVVESAEGTQAEEPSGLEDAEILAILETSDQPGSLGRLGHYHVLEIIGQGGMGIVLRAFDEKLHRVVAIKVMAAVLAATSPPRKRFLREARAAAAVRHDNVVDIHAVEEQPIPYLVMEYVPGETLQQKLDRVGPLETPEVLRLGQQIARGLAAAHAQGLIHRDIKPSNILLEKGAEERVKITDFGLARAVADASLTQSGVIAGTPMYMAPEQTVGDTIDHRADLFSLGSVLYTMCSGRPPFRATTSMATLKRVAEDQPRPIREIIPEVPQWLCDVIARLHAKKPDERFQSAKEVAELLRQHLAHLENPTLAPMPNGVVGRIGNPSQGNRPVPISSHEDGRIANPPYRLKPHAHKRRWTVVAAIMLALLGGLSLTEATGVTNLRGTVIRIFTPEGTLVVEIDDPGVKVTIEGDSDLVISGAGIHEVRRKPGSYKVQADRDGKRVPLERELISIVKGGREIVRVKLEAPAGQAAAQMEKGVFVLLDGKGVEVRKYDTLRDAVVAATAGDIIEIRGNGPFVTEPIKIGTPGLTIRSAAGYRPVIGASQSGTWTKEPLVLINGSLVLEGVEFDCKRSGTPVRRPPTSFVILAAGPSLSLTNCRFSGDLLNRESTTHYGVYVHSGAARVRNCEFVGATEVSVEGACELLTLVNCVHVGNIPLCMGFYAEKRASEYRLSHNTFVTDGMQALHFFLPVNADDLRKTLPDRPVKVVATSNVIDATILLYLEDRIRSTKPLTAREAEAMLPRLVAWTGRENLYRVSRHFVIWQGAVDIQPPLGPHDLNDWKQFCGSRESGSVEGKIRYQGGDLLAKLASAPARITPEDFRLRPDSAAYRAGKDGKDLGADVDLVGPGVAYDRWKKTPDYQQWLKETGQKK